jgi:tol-pal system protein YbgF
MTVKESILHGTFTIFVLIALLSVAGCATTGDLRRVRGDLNQQIQLTNDRITTIEQGSIGVKDETVGIRKEIQKANEANEKTDQAINALRGSQAENRAAMTELRDQIQQIRGSIDGLRRDLSSSAARISKREEEEKGLREKLDNLTFKINFIENFLGIGKKDVGIGKKEETADAVVEKNGKPTAPPLKEAVGKARTDKESLYAAAYELFREAKYDKSREGFEYFLKLHPDTEFSDNAQFWIGECYYFEKKYEKAIVEYDKVVKKYPEGNKIPFALLKQGLSFEKLGDKASAKLLLQQVIRDFPNTSQSRIARAKLLEIR